MMLALAVLDLPFAAGQHATELDGARLTLRAASPLLLVRKEILEATPSTEGSPILVRQNFFRLDDRYTIRISIGNPRQTQAHVDRCWELLRAAAGG